LGQEWLFISLLGRFRIPITWLGTSAVECRTVHLAVKIRTSAVECGTVHLAVKIDGVSFRLTGSGYTLGRLHWRLLRCSGLALAHTFRLKGNACFSKLC